jgi:hypothetical protein
VATRDQAQLILQVDAQIATAQRSLSQLARSVNQDAASMEKSLDKVAQSHARIGKALNDNGRIRSGFTQLSFQIGDVTQGLTMGTKASTIFAQQSGQVIQALQLMGGEGNAFLRFLSGPWGIALSTAAVILGTLVPKLLDNKDAVGDLVEKMREQAHQAALNKQADEAWKLTIEGLTEAIRKRREEQEKGLQTDIQAEQKALDEARHQAAQQRKNLRDAQKELAQAEQNLATLKGAPSLAGPGGQAQESRVAAAQARVNQLKKQIGELGQAITEAEANVRGAEVPIAERNVENRLDKVKAATDAYTRALGELRRQLQAGAIDQAKFETELAKAAKKRDAAIKAAQESKKTLNDSQSGRQIDFAQAESIARAAGLQVNSGYRSVAQQAALYNDPSVRRPGNPVAPPGASAHNGANGKWAIDIQITDGVTPGKIRKVFADQGVSLTKVLKEKGHFHIEGSRSDAAKAENDAQQQAKRAQDRTQAFQQESERLDADILRAKGDLLGGEEDQADFAVKQLQLDQINYEKSLDRQVQDDKLNALDAEALKLKHQQLTFERIKAVEQGRRLNELKRADEAEQRTFQYQIDDLRFADEMAKSQAAHRQLQLEIIDIVYQQKEAHLKALKAELELAGKIEEAADVQAQIDRLPTEKSQDRTRTYRATQSPLQKYFNDLPHTADQINEAISNIEVQGIDGLVNALSHAGEGWEAMRDIAISTLQEITSELIKLGIQKMVFNLLGSAIGGASGVPTLPIDAFGTGNNAGFATGGFVSGPGGPTSDSIPAMLSNGEYVISAEAVRKFGVGYLDALNSGGVPHMKGGGLLGAALARISPLAFLATGGGKHFNPLALISPLGFLAYKGFKASGNNPLALLSPAFAMASLLGGNGGPKIPNVPNIKGLPAPANNNGDTYNIHVVAPNTGDPLKDRQTGMQFAAGIEAGMARRRAKGLVG